MRDIRLLTLYKQHYLDFYKEPLSSQYTCLGYYDGLDITEVTQASLDLSFVNTASVPVSELWYATGKKIEKLKGGYSSQNIGVFRCVSDKKRILRTEEFWRDMNQMPYLVIGFLQIENNIKYDDIGGLIELEEEDTSYRILTYCTYDNADLVLLIQGNDLWRMKQRLEHVEDLSEVRYLHSLINISENYLKDCKKSGRILENWNHRNCFVDQPLKKLTMQFVTAGDRKILSKLKYVMDRCHKEWNLKGYENAVYSYKIGHENAEIMLQDTDIRTLMVLLLPGGFATHQNSIYEQGLYNIETSIVLKEDRWENLAVMEPDDRTDPPDGWCRRLIQKYSQRLRPVLDQRDESLFSYYQALIQTLITLDQYEHFRLSRYIFYLLFPAFDMFERQFEEALKRAEEDYYTRIEDIKESVCQFLNSVNSVVYHTVHTDQIFLMIPGYSGTSFSIPIKLSLMYLWFIDQVAEVLNDNRYEYQCVLTPEMESRPITKLINFGLSGKDRLICVKLSQRSLFKPKNLMVILSHEIGHYIGDELRSRDLRLRCIIKTMAYFMAEGICPEESNYYRKSEYGELYESLKDYVKSNLQLELSKALADEVRMRCRDREYYACDIENILIESCLTLIASENADVRDIIMRIPDDVMKMAEKNRDRMNSYMRFLYEVQMRFEENRQRMLIKNNLQNICCELIQAYKEVFADMAALTILQCKEEDFHQSFYISEGMYYDDKYKPSQQWARERIAHAVVFGGKSDISPTREYECNYYDPIQNMYSYIWTENYLIEYAGDCYKKLKKRLEEPECCVVLKEIRKLFQTMKGESECFEIYGEIMKRICEYEGKIEQLYQRRFSDK